MKVITVGRSSSNNIVVPDNNVSRTHCQFIQDDNGGYYVMDLNSTNGTFVNGVRRSGKTRLNPNDIVKIGNTPLPWRNYFIGAEPGTQIDPPHTPYPPYPQYPQYPQPEPEPEPPTSKPSSYLTMAILSTIFCCMPFGVVSIVYAAKVNSLWNNGDYDEAIEAAHKAKTWFWLSFSFGLLAFIIYIIYYAFIAAGSLLFF